MDETRKNADTPRRDASRVRSRGMFARLLGDGWVETAPGIFYPAATADSTDRDRPARVVSQPARA